MINNFKDVVEVKLRPLVYGVVAGVIVWLAAFFLAGFILYLTGANDFFVVAAVKVIIAISAFAAGYVAGKMCNTKRFLWGLGAGLIMFLLTMILGTFIGENGGIAADEVINLVLFSVFSLVGGMIS